MGERFSRFRKRSSAKIVPMQPVSVRTTVMGDDAAVEHTTAVSIVENDAGGLSVTAEERRVQRFDVQPEAWAATNGEVAAKTASDPLEPAGIVAPAVTDVTAAAADELPRWRAVLLTIVTSRVFDAVVLLLIIASSIALVFEDSRLRHNPGREHDLWVASIFFATAFTLEMLLKIGAYGPWGYVSSPWNCLDAFIVAISIAALAASGGNLTALRSLRTLRALRPLRAISRWEGMKVVINALFSAIPQIGNVLLLCSLFWLIFAILGVQFFGGQFYKCIDTSTEELFDVSVVNDKAACLARNDSAWVNSNVNFDHVGTGFIALFQVATFEGWMEVMQDAVDQRGVDMQPSREHTFHSYVFFVIFIIAGSFFTLNLFIGVIIDSFNRLKRKYEALGREGVFLTDHQRQYLVTIRRMVRTKPRKLIPRPRGRVASWCYDMANPDSLMERIILGIIVLNLFVLAMEHYDQSSEWNDAQLTLNLIFTSCYLIEAAIKFIGHRWHYFDRFVVRFKKEKAKKRK